MKDRIGGLATLLALTSLAIPRGATSKAKTGAASEERAGATSGGDSQGKGRGNGGSHRGDGGGNDDVQPACCIHKCPKKTLLRS